MFLSFASGPRGIGRLAASRTSAGWYCRGEVERTEAHRPASRICSANRNTCLIIAGRQPLTHRQGRPRSQEALPRRSAGERGASTRKRRESRDRKHRGTERRESQPQSPMPRRPALCWPELCRPAPRRYTSAQALARFKRHSEAKRRSRNPPMRETGAAMRKGAIRRAPFRVLAPLAPSSIRKCQVTAVPFCKLRALANAFARLFDIQSQFPRIADPQSAFSTSSAIPVR